MSEFPDGTDCSIEMSELMDQFRHLTRRDQREVVEVFRRFGTMSIDQTLGIEVSGGISAALLGMAAALDLLAESPDYHECDQCGASFPSEASFKRHKGIIGSGKKRREVCQ